MLFSERNNLTAPKTMQIDSLDARTRTKIFNLIYNTFSDKLYYLVREIWTNYLIKPAHEEPWEKIKTSYGDYRRTQSPDEILNKWIMSFGMEKIFDTIEFTANYLSLRNLGVGNFLSGIEKIFKEECVQYSIINSQIVQISDKLESDEISKALESPYDNVKKHFKKALDHFADRENPDYRNSIKESISAVEAYCRNITNESTLDRALKKLETHGLMINQQLKAGLEKMYCYTSGKDGIRHALMQEENITVDDARFMLIICSAFVNYMTVKTSKLQLSTING